MDNQNYTLSAGLSSQDYWDAILKKSKIITFPGVNETILILSPEDYKKLTDLGFIKKAEETK